MRTILTEARVWFRELVRTAAPSLLMGFCMLASFTLGEIGQSPWLVLIPMVFGGFALGMAIDRAENRAGRAWADKFWSLIESDHTLEVTVTHKNQ